MDDAEDQSMSPLSQTVNCKGQLLHIDIWKDDEGRWSLAVTNEQRVTSHWTKSFKTDQAALKEALKTIKAEGPEGFAMETPYKPVLQ